MEKFDQFQNPILKLRKGFIFSLGILITLLIVWILNVIYFLHRQLIFFPSIFFIFPFCYILPFLLAFLYVMGIYNRASAWEHMNEHIASILISIGGSIIFLSPFWLWYLWMKCFNYCAIPLAIWLIYTIFELRALNVLEKNYELNLKKAKICIIAGVILATASLIFLRIPEFLHLEYQKTIAILSSLFTLVYIYPYPNLPIPFLITSCILVIRELTRKIKTTC